VVQAPSAAFNLGENAMAQKDLFLFSRKTRTLSRLLTLLYTALVVFALALEGGRHYLSDSKLANFYSNTSYEDITIFLLISFSVQSFYLWRKVQAEVMSFAGGNKVSREFVIYYAILAGMFVVSSQLDTYGGSKAGISLLAPMIGPQILFLWIYWHLKE
jgi:hypothetical protein